MKKKLILFILAIFIFLGALGLTLYPLISTAYNEKHRSEVHTQYENSLLDIEHKELIEERRKAVAYNRSLTNYSPEALQEAENEYKELLNLMDYTEKLTENKSRITLNIAINYGGRHEIASAVKEIAKKAVNGEIDPDSIDENLISDYLYTKGQPDPDLIIRPSGEFRTSNFLTWQGAYSELWFSDVLWPDFTEENFNEALRAFEKRNRRFGGV